MLKRFSVENFKGFKDKITLDLGLPSNYSFNSEIIENGCVSKGIIYGINSCGKSNLGLAIFDIITHLTEKQKLFQNYDFYLNMSGRKVFAELKSIGQSEFYQAQAVGLKPEIKFVLPDYLEYSNEQIVRFQEFGKDTEEEYTVLRTYRNNNLIELVCKRGVD